MPKNLLPEFENIIEIAKKWATLIAAVVALLTFKSGNRLVSYVFIAIFCVLLDRFLWRSVERKIFAVLSVLIVTIAPAGWIGVNAWGFEVWPARTGELLFLVARFDQRGTRRINPTPMIAKGLEDAIRDANINARIAVVSTIANDVPGKAEAEARRKGQIHGAIFAIWGSYDDLGFSPHFTITKSMMHELQQPQLAVVPTLTSAELDHFSLYIRDGLPAQMAYFATFTVGQLYYWDDKFDEALRAFDVALANLEHSRVVEGVPPPEGLETLYLQRGYAYYAKHQLDQTIANYTEAIKLNPKYAKAYNNRGFVYAEKGQLDQAIADYTNAIKLDPNYALAYVNRGIAYSNKGQLDQAIADYTKAIEINPKYVNEPYYSRGTPYTPKRLYAEAYFNRGIAYSNKGQLDQAIADYTEAIKLDPNYALAYVNRGIAYSNKGQLDQAIADYTKAIGINPGSAEAYNYRGDAYNHAGNREQAIADFTKAIQLEPQLGLAYYNRGVVYSDKGRLDEALADYTRAIDLDPKNADAYNNRGNLHRLRGELDPALADFDRAIDLNPKDGTAYLNRGLVYFDKREFDRAIDDYSRAIELDPKDDLAYNNRGNVYRVKGSLDAALTDLNKATDLNPKLPSPYENRGLLYRDRGLKSQAAAEFESYLRLASDAKDRAQVEQWLRELK